MTTTVDRYAYLDDPDPFAVEPAAPAFAPPARSAPREPGATRRRAPKLATLPGVVRTEPVVVASDLTPLQAYDYAQRDRARMSGEPTDRTRAPGVIPGVDDEEGGTGETPFAYLWIDEVSNRILHTTDDFDGGVPCAVSAQVLADLIDAGYRLVMPDDLVATRVTRACAAAARSNDPGKAKLAARVSHQLAVMSHLSWSSLFIVLTHALSRRFWLPLPFAADDSRAWAAAFGISRTAMNHKTMGKLLALASDGVATQGATKGIFFAERSAVRSSAFPGLRASVAAFQAVNRAEAAMSALTLTDTMLLDRHVLTGEVCRLQVTATSVTTFEAVASQPFKMRTGKDHVLTSAIENVNNAHVTLESVRADGDDLIAVVGVPERTGSATPSSRTSRRTPPCVSMAREAYGSRRALYLYEKPFSSRPPAAGEGGMPVVGRWSTGRAVEPIAPKWSVPVEVAIAGAPDRA